MTFKTIHKSFFDSIYYEIYSYGRSNQQLQGAHNAGMTKLLML